MAALRIFARSAISSTIRRNLNTTECSINYGRKVQTIQTRCVSVKVGYGDREQEIELPEYEVTKDPKEWNYVEWALPAKLVPKPPSEFKEYPSGWRPQSPKAKSLPYFVDRTKSHMIPVYLKITDRGMKKITFVKYIHGDIMQLSKDLKEFLKEKYGKDIGTQVNEPACLIKLRGDFVSWTKIFLEQKGF